jgi:cellulose synthase/poly-beta-1,6-N-acetylglucosamine synthase-like glycosyltransferase
MITVVITAYKEPRTIGKAIEQILKNKITEDYELIVMAPDEETLNAARKYLKYSKKIKILKDEGKGKPAALNMFFKKAKGRIIILTDGDVHIKENAIPFLLKKFEDPRVGAVTGRPISTNDRKTMLGFWSHLLTDAAHHTRERRIKDGKMIVCSGYLYAIRAGIIESIPEDALSDDAVISHMIFEKGYITHYSPDAEVYIKYPDNFKDWIKQKKRSAGGYNQLARMVKNKERMRSFGKEVAGILFVLAYPKTFLEMFHTTMLVLARIYLWILIFIDINIRKKEFKKIWVRVESTK